MFQNNLESIKKNSKLKEIMKHSKKEKNTIQSTNYLRITKAIIIVLVLVIILIIGLCINNENQKRSITTYKTTNTTKTPSTTTKTPSTTTKTPSTTTKTPPTTTKTPPTTSILTCPNGWDIVQSSGSCFKIFQKNLSFIQALSYCPEVQPTSYLAEIITDDEFEYLKVKYSTTELWVKFIICFICKVSNNFYLI
jgi:hypothetical protein